MRTVLASILAAVVVALGAMYLLDQGLQRRAEQAFTSPTSVRIPDHGNTHNLVGLDWSSASNHGWGDEVPTGNSPTNLTK